MSNTEIFDIFYSFYLYMKEDYDCFKYNFNIPKNMKNHTYKKMLLNQKFNLEFYRDFSRKDIILCAIQNNLISPKMAIEQISPSQMKNQLITYKTTLKIDLEVIKKTNLSPNEIFQLYMISKISWITFYSIFHYVNLGEIDDIIKIKLQYIWKIYKIFNFKVDDFIEEFKRYMLFKV